MHADTSRGFRSLRIAEAVRAGLILALVGASLALSAGVAEAAATPGSPVTNFGSAGVVSLSTGTQLFGVAVQSNGEVVAAGQSGGEVFVERFTTGGRVDGKYVGPSGYARAVSVQSDGKIVIAGSLGSATKGVMFVQRLTSALTPDSSFGSGGTTKVALPSGGGSSVGNAVAIQSNGTIVAAGTAMLSVPLVGSKVQVAQLRTNGAVVWNKSFPFSIFAAANGVAIQSNGKIVVVGSAKGSSGLTGGLVVGLTSTGALDTTFANGGSLNYFYPTSGYTSFNAVVLQSDGKIVTSGVDASGPNALVVRLNANGGRDSTFGSNGVAAQLSGQLLTIKGDHTGAYGVALAAGGNVVAAGNYEYTATYVNPTLYAFTPAGSPNKALIGGTGTARTMTLAESCALAVIAPSGSLVAVGNTVPNSALPDTSPCGLTSGSAGFVAEYNGFGPTKTALPFAMTLNAVSPYSKTSATKNGFKFSVNCNQACRLKATLTASAAIAKKLGIGKKVRVCKTVRGKRRCTTVTKYSSITIATQQAALKQAGTQSFTMNNTLFQRALRTSKVVAMGLSVSGTPSTGKSQTQAKLITFK